MKRSKKQNFIQNLWNGNESLGLSFWAVYISIGILGRQPGSGITGAEFH